MKIHVAIPMAGHSRRFKEAGHDKPKALLPVGDKLMIEHVIDMFDPEQCIFHIVVNAEQERDYPEIHTLIPEMAPNVKITVIDPHEDGPSHSVLQIVDIPEDAPFIVSYCDFFVEWDFQKFVYQIDGADGAIPAFSGFHPASFGDTFYAYMRINADGRLLELREKKSFTDKRHEEPASTGIYFFRHFSLFRHYADRLINSPIKELPESYVSLVFNDMVNDGLNVHVPEVNRFICLGTPSDYEQFLFWHRYFSHQEQPLAKIDSEVKQVALIPMAGRGSRFVEHGYRVAKPMIQVDRKPMVAHAINSHPVQDKWVFIARSQDVERHLVNRIFDEMNLDYTTIMVDHVTSGQAATCLLAENEIDDDAELFISSCDYRTIFDHQAWQTICDDKSIDGAIWTTRLKGIPVKNPEAFAYCKVEDDSNLIREVVEKRTISASPHLDPLVIGTFWFRRAADFKLAANMLIDRNILVNGEHYVGTSINSLLDMGRKFIIFDVDQWVSFGDPFELEVLEYWREYFC
jgi:NDP-sugar pyrophosphorylase family protein